MDNNNIFVYVGTWPLLMRGPIPGFKDSSNDATDIKTGIFGFRMDVNTGDWTPTSNFYTSSMTSELCLSRDGKFLYSNDEDRDRKGVKCAGGSALGFSINREDGSLTFINEQASMGTSPTYVETDATGRYVFAANLGNPHDQFAKIIRTADGGFEMTTQEEEGSIAMFKILDDGSLSQASDVLGFEDANGYSHYHCIKVDPSNKFLLVCDTDDKIQVFRIDYENGKLLPAENPAFKTRPGVEPRTILFHPTQSWFFVNNQSNSTVYSFSFDASNGKIEELDYTSAVFELEDSMKSWTADMAISSDGKYLYVSNRSLQKLRPNIKCPPHTVAVFQIDLECGKLELIAVTNVEAENPRGIALAPKGNFLYITSLDTNEIYRYDVNPESGMLSNPKVVAHVPVPSSIKLLVAD